MGERFLNAMRDTIIPIMPTAWIPVARFEMCPTKLSSAKTTSKMPTSCLDAMRRYRPIFANACVR